MKTISNKEFNFIIYTDGACLGNPGPGGWAAIIINENNEKKEISGSEENTTNNRMELQACINALNFTVRKKHVMKILVRSRRVASG